MYMNDHDSQICNRRKNNHMDTLNLLFKLLFVLYLSISFKFSNFICRLFIIVLYNICTNRLILYELPFLFLYINEFPLLKICISPIFTSIYRCTLFKWYIQVGLPLLQNFVNVYTNSRNRNNSIYKQLPY